MEGVDGFLPELPRVTMKPIMEIYLNDLVEGLIGFYVGEQTIMGCFSDLWLGVAEVSDHVFEQFRPDIILDLFGIEVDDLQCQSTG